MVKISGQTEVGCALTHHPSEKPNSASFWYFGHNFLVLTPIQPSFKPTDSPFIPLQDCEIKLNLPLGLDGVDTLYGRDMNFPTSFVSFLTFSPDFGRTFPLFL